jgi:hypothetical protein
MRKLRVWLGFAALVLAAGATVAIAEGASDRPQSVPGGPSSQPDKSAIPGVGIAVPEADQVSGFAAFRRPQTATDQGIEGSASALQALGRAQSSFQVNPALARNVYSGTSAKLYLVPGAGTLCLVAITSDNGVQATCTSTANALAEGIGFVSGSSNSDAFTFGGVFPNGAHSVKIVSRAGEVNPVPLNSDNGYWLTASSAVNMVWTTAAGSEHQTPFGRFNLSSVLAGSPPQ